MILEVKNQIKSGEYGKFSEVEKLKDYTTLKIGGIADIMVFPENEEQIISLVKLCSRYDEIYTVIGLGSNILVSDKGIRGVVIVLRENFSKISVDGNQIKAFAGTSLRDVAIKSFENELTGMEPVSGIPGTVGGAIIMNAGAYGREMVDIVKTVRCINKHGEIFDYTNAEMQFSYRNSIAAEKELLVLSATFILDKGVKNDIYEKFKEYDEKRWSKQPMDAYSAGSTFKRPDGYFASKLIDESGLRGFTVGEAMVSEKHCGFLINKSNSTCENFLKLIEEVKRVVNEKHSVHLEREVKLIGER